MARPTKLHGDHPAYPGTTIADGIIRDLTAGIWKHDAAGRAGIAQSTIHAWIARGNDHLTRLAHYDTEHPDALDCTHTWTKSRQPRCKTCHTPKATWDDLQEAERTEGPFAEFAEGCARAQAQAKVRVQSLLLDAMRTLPPQAVLDGDGRPVLVGGVLQRDRDGNVVYDAAGDPVILGQRVQVARPDRGDWRAAAWWLERIDPSQFHLPSKVEVSGDPDGAPIQVDIFDKLNDELDELAKRMAEADEQRRRALGDVSS